MKPLCHMFLIFASITWCSVAGQNAQCPLGQYTKETPSAESGMEACKEYACNSCCKAELTTQLAMIPLQEVGGLNYNQCGGLSAICSQYMSYIQCFYQCSPNLYPWLGQYGRLNELPLCGSFCDEWFNACSNDKSCVQGTDWTKGYDAVDDPNNPGKKMLQCKPNQPCRNFTEIYQNSEKFCSEMWLGAIRYESDKTKCMNPAGTTSSNEAFFNSVDPSGSYSVCEEVSYIDTGAIIGIVIGCLAGLALICGAILFFLRNKQMKPADKKVVAEKSDPKELQELKPDETLE